jgi:phage major head subunit gpT-like protein
MAVQITFPLLGSINDAVSMSFNTQLYASSSLYKQFSFTSNSTGAAEIYPRLDELFGLREWVGDRQVQSLSQTTFQIPNRTFEQTIGIKREDIEDDKYGILSPVAMQMGQNAGELPDLLVTSLFAQGHTTLTYDGQNFFDTSHPNYNSTGAVVAVPNYQAGGDQSWYLIDASRIQKPFIFQNRRPFKTVPKFSMTDQNVFFDNEYVWGVDGRCNAGYGLWQLAFRSDAALTLANLVAARNSMATLRRPNGTPMGIGQRGLMLVVPTALYPSARAYCENDFLPAGDPAATGSGTVANTFKGLAKVLENPWLN